MEHATTSLHWRGSRRAPVLFQQALLSSCGELATRNHAISSSLTFVPGRYDEPQTLSGDSTAICSPEQGDAGVLGQSGAAGDSTEYLACQCGAGRVNYNGSDGNSELACVADPSLASSTSSMTMSTSTSASSTLSTSSTSSSITSLLSTSTSSVTSSSAATFAMTTTSSVQASSTAAAVGQPQASMKRRRRVRRSLLRFS